MQVFSLNETNMLNWSISIPYFAPAITLCLFVFLLLIHSANPKILSIFANREPNINVMQSITPSLKAYIENEIIPRYAEFDKAHNLDHVRAVIRESLRIAAHYAEARLDMVYAIAAYHDTGLAAGREFHHIASGRIVEADTALRQWFAETEIQQMKEAVEDHRASSDHEPRSLYGRIVAEADRLIDPDITLRRTIQYGLKHQPTLDKEGQYNRFCQHLHDKYAEGGYLKLWIPFSSNAAKLEELRRIIADPILLRQAFDKLYKEETSTPRTTNLSDT